LYIYLQKIKIKMRFSEKSFFNRILLLLLVLAGSSVATTVFYIFFIFIKSLSGQESFDSISLAAATNPDIIRILQAISSVFFFILPPFIMTYIYKENPENYLSLKKPSFKNTTLGAISLIVAIPIINLLVVWNESMHLPSFMSEIEIWMRNSEDNASRITKLLLSGTSLSDLALNFVIIAIMAGVGEELFFRGLLQSLISGLLNKENRFVIHISIWIVAFLFSAIHLQFYGFIPRMLMGAWFGYLLLWSGSIWVPIIAHATNNGLSTIFSYLENKGTVNFETDAIGTGETFWLSILSALLLTGIMLIFKKGDNPDSSVQKP